MGVVLSLDGDVFEWCEVVCLEFLDGEVVYVVLWELV